MPTCPSALRSFDSPAPSCLQAICIAACFLEIWPLLVMCSPGTPDLEVPNHGTFPRPQAICIAACFPDDWPMVVVCPSSLRLQWYAALLTWTPPALLSAPDQIAIVAAGKVGRLLNLLIILMLESWSGAKRLQCC